MQYPGMKERVERELLAMRPFQSHFKVQGPFKKKTVYHYTLLTKVLNLAAVTCSRCLVSEDNRESVRKCTDAAYIQLYIYIYIKSFKNNKIRI